MTYGEEKCTTQLEAYRRKRELERLGYFVVVKDLTVMYWVRAV